MLKTPLLWPSIHTPAEELAPIKDLYAHLTGLAFSVEAWEAGLLLYQTALSPPASIPRAVAGRWRFIACHECILELFHLRARLSKIQSVKLRNCPSVAALVDSKALRNSRKQLDTYFPDIEALRHATAHSGENEAHPEIHAPDGQYALMGFREPNRFSAPYQGKLRYLDITRQSLERITEVVNSYLMSFAPAAAALKVQGYLE
jgi:hypothetical protein